MYFSMIELETNDCYIVIHLTHYNIQVYYFAICISSELRKHLIHIHIQQHMYSFG
jgi:hypothetical protein